MEALIQVDDGNADVVHSLYGWLGDEQDLRGMVRLVPAHLRETDLGGVSDAIVVAVGAGGAGTVLASSLATWLQTRRTAVRLVIQCGERKLSLDMTTSKNVLPLVERLLESDDEP
jgi:hypothetical protein